MERLVCGVDIMSHDDLTGTCLQHSGFEAKIETLGREVKELKVSMQARTTWILAGMGTLIAGLAGVLVKVLI